MRILYWTRNDYEGETPCKHDVSLFFVHERRHQMNERDRNLQHAMMSFALFGGMLVNTRRHNDGRHTSPSSAFTPISPRKPRR